MNTQRPLSVAIAVVLLALLSLLYLIFPLLPTEGVPTLVVYSNVVWGVAGLAVAAGLWMLRRWSMRLAIVLCVLAILSASPGLTAASSALLGVLATVVVAGAVLIILLVVLPSSQRAYA
jgi:hypothetical protein